MDLFKLAKLNLAMCFFRRNQTQIFDVKRLLGILLGISTICSILLFVFFENNNVTDYVISAFLSVSALSIFISFIDTAFKTTQIFSLIDIMVDAIEKSNYCQLLGIICPAHTLFHCCQKAFVFVFFFAHRNGIFTIEGTVHQNESSIGTIL